MTRRQQEEESKKTKRVSKGVFQEVRVATSVMSLKIVLEGTGTG